MSDRLRVSIKVGAVMGLGNLFKSLFSGSSNDSAGDSAEQISDPVEYNGFTIEPAPIKEGTQYRTAGYISGRVTSDAGTEETKRVQYIRADSSGDKQSAIDHSLSKGKQIVDEQGASLLQRSHL